MKKIFLPEENEKLKYYRANLHCHSTLSDGSKTPEELKRDYKAHGYSILAITDHDVFIPHNDLTDDNFLMLNGYELEKGGPDKKTCHICFVALDKDIDTQVCYHRTEYCFGNSIKTREKVKYDESKPDYVRVYSSEGISDMIKQGRDNGFFVTYNHAAWSLETYPEYTGFKGMNAMEIVNFGCVIAGYPDENSRVYDDILRSGQKLYCIATDDNHNRHPDTSPDCDSYGGFIMVASESLKYSDVARAIENGQFYSSTGNYMHTGPEIKGITYEDGKVTVKTSDVRSISLITDIRCAKIKNAPEGETINEAELVIDKEIKWFRIVATDLKGYNAYSNACFVEE